MLYIYIYLYVYIVVGQVNRPFPTIPAGITPVAPIMLINAMEFHVATERVVVLHLFVFPAIARQTLCFPLFQRRPARNDTYFQ